MCGSIVRNNKPIPRLQAPVSQAYVPEPPVKSDYRGMLSAQASSAHRARPYDIEGGPLGPQGIQKLVRPLTVRKEDAGVFVDP